MLRENEQDNDELIKIKKQFKDELSFPLNTTNEIICNHTISNDN